MVVTSVESGGTAGRGWLVEATSEPHDASRTAALHSTRPGIAERCMGTSLNGGKTLRRRDVASPQQGVFPSVEVAVRYERCLLEPNICRLLTTHVATARRLPRQCRVSRLLGGLEPDAGRRGMLPLETRLPGTLIGGGDDGPVKHLGSVRPSRTSRRSARHRSAR